MPLSAIELVQMAKQHIQEIEPAQAQDLVKTVLVLDVREPGEYAAGCLPGAVNIPRGVLEFRIGSLPGCSPDAALLVYCQSGGRSALAVETLGKMGYEKAVSLAGGYKGWQDQGLPVITPVM